MPVYDEKYIKTKANNFTVWLKQTLKQTKENKHYTCISCVTIDSVMKIEKKNYPQVFLKECKYKIKKTNL